MPDSIRHPENGEAATLPRFVFGDHHGTVKPPLRVYGTVCGFASAPYNTPFHFPGNGLGWQAAVAEIVRPIHTKETEMKSKFLLVLLSVAGLMLGSQSAQAASMAVREMAGIMMNLKHYPGDEEKGKLKAIVADKASTDQERVIANAIMNLEHEVASGDADKLRKVTGDMSAPAEVRDLAGIVLNISHRPSASDKRKLEAMMK
jgi:hypothetical protein